MTVRVAACRCGRLRATCHGEPVRISVCHCLACQRRSGSAFAVQARWPGGQVQLSGDHREWSAPGGSGSLTHFRFCPTCGVTVSFVNEGAAETTAVPVGLFADPAFPAPGVSIYEESGHPWVAVRGDVEHFD